MVLEYIPVRTNKTDTGDNEYYIHLPPNSILQMVSAKNLTRYFRPIHIDIAGAEHNTETLGLMSSQTQIGNRSVLWHGPIPMGDSYRLVKVVFHRCVAGDDLAIRVGYSY